MSVEVQFDESELDRNTQLVFQAATNPEAEAAKKGFQALNNSIDLFITQYELAYQEILIFQNELKTIIKEWHNVKNSLPKSEEYKQSPAYLTYLNKRKELMENNFLNKIQKTTLNIYLLAFKIQQLLNAALGQEVVTAYVFQQSGSIAPQVILSQNMKDFLQAEVSNTGNVVLRYRQSQQNLDAHISEIQQMVKSEQDKQNYNKLVTAYNKAHTRYKNYPLQKKRGSYVLWLYPYGGQKWNGAYVSSFGSVNEAYAYFLFNLDKFNPSSALEDDMEILMNYLISQVTNESGLLAGDFQSGRMQVAVKSADASALGLRQIYQLAKKIKTQKIDNFQAIVKFLQDEKKKRQDRARPINKSLKQSLQYIADKYLPQAVGQLG